MSPPLMPRNMACRIPDRALRKDWIYFVNLTMYSESTVVADTLFTLFCGDGKAVLVKYTPADGMLGLRTLRS